MRVAFEDQALQRQIHQAGGHACPSCACGRFACRREAAAIGGSAICRCPWLGVRPCGLS